MKYILIEMSIILLAETTMCMLLFPIWLVLELNYSSSLLIISGSSIIPFIILCFLVYKFENMEVQK